MDRSGSVRGSRALQHALDELAAAACRVREPEGVPSLEEFAQGFEADFHSQDELLALYQAEHGQAPGAQAAQRAARRRTRLMQCQLQLITELEGLAAEDLTPASPLAAWFAPAIAERLHQADLFTVAQLVERIASVPRRWWSGIPGMGAGAVVPLDQLQVLQELSGERGSFRAAGVLCPRRAP